MGILHDIAVSRLLAQGLAPTPAVLAEIAARLCRRIGRGLVIRIMRGLRRGMPRVQKPGASAPKKCLIDEEGVDPERLGFALNAEGVRLGVEEWMTYVAGLRNRLRGYWYEYKTRRHLKSRRWVRAHRQVEAFLVTHSPWHSAALLLRPDSPNTFLRCATNLMREFERITTLNTLGVVAHLAEGCAHYHVLFSRLRFDGTRVELSLNHGPGRRVFGCLGIAQVAALRRGLAGRTPPSRWHPIRRRCREMAQRNHGLPIDWHLSRWLDRYIRTTFPKIPNK